MHKNSATFLNTSMIKKSPSIVVNKTKTIKPFTKNIRHSMSGDNSKSEFSSKTFSPSVIGKQNSSSFKNSSLKRPTTAKSNKKTSTQQRRLKIADFYRPEVQDSLKTLLRQEVVDNFIGKFGHLTETIVKLIASEESLDPHSLDTVLSREIANSLGPTTNNSKLSQQFIQGTSYRDQYLKELVMNLLQSMCSNEIEEEISRMRNRVCRLSIGSTHRGNAIRNLVRAKAGIEPKLFQYLEQELEEFQRTLSKNKLKVLKATNEVERIIAEHLKRETSSLNSLQIPNTDPEVLKIVEAGAGCDCGDKESNRSCCMYNHGCLFNNNLSKTYLRTAKSSFQQIANNNERTNAGNSSQGLPGRVSLPGLDIRKNNKPSFELTEDIIKHIQPQIQKIVQNELLNVRKKSAVLMNAETIKRCKGSICSINQCIKPSEINLSSTADDYFDEENKMKTQENLMFSESSRTNLQQNNSVIAQNCLDNRIDLNIADRDYCKLSYESDNFELPKYNKSMQIDNRSCINNYNQPSKTTLDNKVPKHDRYPTSVSMTKLSNQTSRGRNLEEFGNLDITLVDANPTKQIIPVRSKLSLGDKSLAKSIEEDLKEACQNEDTPYTCSGVDNQIQENKSTGGSNSYLNNNFNFTIKEMAYILEEISLKVIEFPSLLLRTDSAKKNEIFTILSTIEHSLNGSQPINNDCFTPVTKDEHLLLLVDNISKTFSLLSEKLHFAPLQYRNQPISTLNPPNTLTTTLAYLFSTDYFKNCFMSVSIHKNLHREQLGGHECRMPQLENKTKDLLPGSALENETKDLLPRSFSSGNDIQEIHLQIPKQISSETMNPFFEQSYPVDSIAADITQNADAETVSSEINNITETQKHLEHLEHNLELHLSEMTLQNTSDSFLYLSNVLNDLPNWVKTSNLLELKPPTNLIKALNILYSDNSAIEIGDHERKSFESLTVQNASDFLLSLSKVLQDAPLRIKNKLVLEINPPESLIAAINILSSSQSSMNLSQKEEHHETVSLVGNRKDSQESFFDALESLGEN